MTRGQMFRTPFLQRLAIVILLVAVLLAGIMIAAGATADRFYASRIVAWREADFRDFEGSPPAPCPQGRRSSPSRPRPRTLPST